VGKLPKLGNDGWGLMIFLSGCFFLLVF